MTKVREIFNKRLDAAARSRRPFFAPRRAFRRIGAAGVVLAIALAMTLVLRRGLSPWVMGGLILGAVATFLALAMVTKIVVGRERLTYYHHKIAVLMVAAGLLAVWRLPVLAYLDVTMLGVGLFLACGRVGCLMVGCCHGLPHRWGVRYTPAHVEAGFSTHLVGVRLFPVQLVESIWVLFVVMTGTAFVWRGDAAGEALVWYVVLYVSGRFWLEFVRGDRERPYIGGFSEAQWTSLLLVCATAVAERQGTLPRHDWHAAAAVVMVVAMIAVAVWRRLQGTSRLLHPRHIHEMAEALDDAFTSAGIRVHRTTLGIRISASRTAGATGSMDHYSLSQDQGAMTQEVAAALARVILRLKPPGGPNELIRGGGGVFHLVVRGRG